MTSNLDGEPWERVVGYRKPEKTVKYYSTKLPEGVRLLQIYVTRNYQLRKGGLLLDTRPRSVVMQWENPERVFAYIARRALRERAKRAKPKEDG